MIKKHLHEVIIGFSGFFLGFQIFAIVFFVSQSMVVRNSVNHSEVLATSTSVTERFVPLGTGSIQGTDWTDVNGSEVTINTSYYGKIQKVYFEASIGSPTLNGRTYVRLYNVTDKHPVWYSELSVDSVASALVTSQNVSLGSGAKVYKVQMKNSLNATVNLYQARIRIQS